MALNLQSHLRLSFQYCFTIYEVGELYPFDREEFEKLPGVNFTAYSPSPKVPLPVINIFKEKATKTLYENLSVKIRQGDETPFFEGQSTAEAIVWETGFGTIRIDFFNSHLQQLSKENIVKLLLLGANYEETKDIKLELKNRKPYSSEENKPLLWKLFCDIFKKEVFQKWFKSKVFCVETHGIYKLISIVLNKLNRHDKCLVLESENMPYQAPGTILALGLQSWINKNKEEQDSTLKELRHILLRIPEYKLPDNENLSCRDAFQKTETEIPINYLPVRNIFLMLRPTHCVFVYGIDDNPKIQEEIQNSFADMHFLHLTWYTQALVGAWIDKRLQEMPSLLMKVKRKLDVIENKRNGSKILEIQENLAKMMATERPFLARVFEEPIHLRLWSSGMQQVCRYYLDKLGLKGMWDINFDKLEALGRFYDEIMDYIRIRDAKIAESQIEKEKKQWR